MLSITYLLLNIISGKNIVLCVEAINKKLNLYFIFSYAFEPYIVKS